MANFIKIGERNVNTEQIVSITLENNYDIECYIIRMSNADSYRVRVDKESKKLIQGVLNANIQLPSERVTKRTN